MKNVLPQIFKIPRWPARFRTGKGPQERERSLHGSGVRPSPRHTYSQQRPAADHRLPGRQGYPRAAVPRLQLKAPGHGVEEQAPRQGDSPRSRFRLQGHAWSLDRPPGKTRGRGRAEIGRGVSSASAAGVPSDESRVPPLHSDQ